MSIPVSPVVPTTLDDVLQAERRLTDYMHSIALRIGRSTGLFRLDDPMLSNDERAMLDHLSLELNTARVNHHRWLELVDK